jgi:predicted ATPase
LAEIRAYAIEPARLRGFQAADNGSSLLPHGENAVNVLRNIERSSPGDLEQIQEFLTASLPYELQVQAVQYGSQLSLEFRQTSPAGSLDLSASEVSDGTLRLLGLLLVVFQSPPPSVILIEEPEISLHPGNLDVVLDLINAASHRSQVIVTTQSSELLDSAKWIEDRHLRIVYWENGHTCVSRIGRASREALEEHLMGAGELLRSNVLEDPPVARKAPEVTLTEAFP